MNPYNFLESFDKFGAEGGFKPGLERINYLLDFFDHPEANLDIVHVAGSNGKGSTIAYLKNIYRAAGYSVGTFISPPLNRFNERIMIDERMISTEELIELIKRIKPVVEKLEDSPDYTRPSFFEIVTLLAFLFFYEQKPDLVLLEVGLGGRLDATNVIPTPLLSIITEISREHTQILGDTLADIAAEKAGIIKKNCPVITGTKEPAARKVIQKKAELQNSKLTVIQEEYNYRILNSSLEGQTIIVKPSDKSLAVSSNKEYQIRLKIPGQHQIRNALVALGAVEKLHKSYPVQKQTIEQSFCNTKWPGRFEIIAVTPYIILDGAHNPSALKELLNVFKQNSHDFERLMMVISVLQSKDIEVMGRQLAHLAEAQKLQITITQNNNFRAESPKKIAAVFRKYALKYNIIFDFKEALERTAEKCSAADLLCITGSLYTVAEARSILK